MISQVDFAVNTSAVGMTPASARKVHEHDHDGASHGSCDKKELVEAVRQATELEKRL